MLMQNYWKSVKNEIVLFNPFPPADSFGHNVFLIFFKFSFLYGAFSCVCHYVFKVIWVDNIVEKRGIYHNEPFPFLSMFSKVVCKW